MSASAGSITMATPTSPMDAKTSMNVSSENRVPSSVIYIRVTGYAPTHPEDMPADANAG